MALVSNRLAFARRNRLGVCRGTWTLAVLLLLSNLSEAAMPLQDIVVRPGFQAEVAVVGVADPMDLAIDRPGSLVILDRGDPMESGQVLIRVPLPAPGGPPIDARTAPRILVPIGRGGLAYPAGAIAVHPTSGDIFLSEFGGKRLYRLDRSGRLSLYATGFWMLPRTAVRFDRDQDLFVLDFSGQRAVPEADPYMEDRDLLGEARDPAETVIYRVKVNQSHPLPRQSAYWQPIVALPLRSPGSSPSPDWNGGIAVGPEGSLFLATLTGLFQIDGARFALHGRIANGRTPTVCPSGDLYVFQERLGHVLVHLTGGAVMRVDRNGDAVEVIGNLGGTHGLVCDEQGRLYVADSLRNRILRVSRVTIP